MFVLLFNVVGFFISITKYHNPYESQYFVSKKGMYISQMLVFQIVWNYI